MEYPSLLMNRRFLEDLSVSPLQSVQSSKETRHARVLLMRALGPQELESIRAYTRQLLPPSRSREGYNLLFDFILLESYKSLPEKTLQDPNISVFWERYHQAFLQYHQKSFESNGSYD